MMVAESEVAESAQGEHVISAVSGHGAEGSAGRHSPCKPPRQRSGYRDRRPENSQQGTASAWLDQRKPTCQMRLLWQLPEGDQFTECCGGFPMGSLLPPAAPGSVRAVFEDEAL